MTPDQALHYLRGRRFVRAEVVASTDAMRCLWRLAYQANLVLAFSAFDQGVLDEVARVERATLAQYRRSINA